MSARGLFETAPNHRTLRHCESEFVQVNQVRTTRRGKLHNHPSGDPKPSAQDIAVTREIIKALETIQVRVHDHLVVGRDGVASFKSLGLM